MADISCIRHHGSYCVHSSSSNCDSCSYGGITFHVVTDCDLLKSFFAKYYCSEVTVEKRRLVKQEVKVE